MDVKINVGRFYQQPLESHYSIFRRLKTSNRLMSAENFNRYFIWNNARNYKDRVKHVLKLNFGTEQYLPEYYNTVQEEGIDEQLTFRHCVSCAKLYYHSVLFNLPWLTRCPVHGELLVKKCPVCWVERRFNSQVFKNDCPVCGLYCQKNIAEGVLTLRKEIEHTLVPIYNEHVRCYHDEVKLFQLNGSDPNKLDSLQSARLFSESYLPTLSICKGKSRKCLKVLDVPSMRKYSTRLKDSKIELSYSDKHSAIKDVKKFVLNFISDFHRPYHDCFSFSYSTLKNTNPFKASNVCPYCLSAGFWWESVFSYSNIDGGHYFSDAVFLSDIDCESLLFNPISMRKTDQIARLSKLQLKRIFKHAIQSHFFSTLRVMLKHYIRYKLENGGFSKSNLLRMCETYIRIYHTYLLCDDESVVLYLKEPTDILKIKPNEMEIEYASNECTNFHNDLVKQKWVFDNKSALKNKEVNI